MTEHVLTRHSYEAKVLVVPVDARAAVSLGGPAAEALDGITVAPLPGDAASLSGEADMVIVLSCDLSAVDPAVVSGVGAAARDGGAPLGAIIVTPGLRWSEPAAEQGAVTLREAADTVIVVEDLAPALAFLQVLRGGSRVTATKAGV